MWLNNLQASYNDYRVRVASPCCSLLIGVEEEILERCKNDLAEFKVPRWIVALPNFPRTESTNGVKIRRDKLRRMASELLETKEARD